MRLTIQQVSPRCAWIASQRRIWTDLLAGGYGKMEVNAGIMIHLCRCGKVELIKRNILTALIQNKEGGPGQKEVMNLLGGTAIREDKGDSILSGRNRRGFRQTWRWLIWIWRQIRRRRTIVGLCCGDRRVACVVTGVIGVKRVAEVSGVPNDAVGCAESVWRDVGPAVAPGAGIRRARAGM